MAGSLCPDRLSETGGRNPQNRNPMTRVNRLFGLKVTVLKPMCGTLNILCLVGCKRVTDPGMKPSPELLPSSVPYLQTIAF